MEPHGIYNLLWLAFFIRHNSLKVYPCMCQWFVLFIAELYPMVWLYPSLFDLSLI